MSGIKTPARVGVAGATGAVGIEMVNVLLERRFPIRELRALASAREPGRTIGFGCECVPVMELTRENIEGLDLVLFATNADVSREFAPLVAEGGGVAIDNSRAFRMDPDVPLVVPEVNPEAAAAHRGIVANPNCSTIQMVMALKPLHDAAIVKRVVAATYQSVSGTGIRAVDELTEQSAAVLDGDPVICEVYPRQIAFNCLPHIDVFDEAGNSREEIKMIDETRKIMSAPDLAVAVTCVRVPVFRSHAVAINVTTERPLTAEEAARLLDEMPGVGVVDIPEAACYPTQVEASGGDTVWVGRIRADGSAENALWMWVVADNLRKGAALNAVQIAELLADELSG